jgi:type IV secretion system protein VirB10
MTATVSGGPEIPRPKAPMPPLDTRAPRPAIVRLRRGVVVGVVMAAAGLMGGSLAWAFVVQPELRAHARDARLAARPSDTRGTVRPSAKVTDAPATYGDLDRLPEPRRLGGVAPTPDVPKARRRSGGRPSRALGEDRRDDAQSSPLFFAAPPRLAKTPADDSRDGPRADLAAVYNPHALQSPVSPYEVKAGSVVAAALLTGVDTARSGPVSATVTENVFDTVSGRFLLIPQGARLVGRHEGESRYGDRRAFVVWERLILPNGKSLILPKEPGIDAAGAIGVKGQVDRRLAPLAVATLFAGAITALGQVAEDHDGASGGFIGDVGDAAAIEAAQVGGKLIDRELEVRPSIRLQPGALVRVFITRDLILEPYRW